MQEKKVKLATRHDNPTTKEPQCIARLRCGCGKTYVAWNWRAAGPAVTDLVHSKGPRLLHKTCATHSSRARGFEVRKTRARNLETCGRGGGAGGGVGGGKGRGGIEGGRGWGKRGRGKGGEGGTSGQVASRPGRSPIQIGDLQFGILLCQKSQKNCGKTRKIKNDTIGMDVKEGQKRAPPFPTRNPSALGWG